jgi:transposase
MRNRTGLSDERYIDEMKNKIIHLENTLQNNIIHFEKKVAELEAKNVKLERQNEYLLEKLKLALSRTFARHTERFTGEGQLTLFDVKETGASGNTEEAKAETVAVATHTRKKAGRKPLSEHLPREHVYLDIEAEEKQCGCGAALVCIGEDVSERLHMIPQQVWVEVIHKKKYACHECEGSGDEEQPAVRMAGTPGNIMPGSIASPDLLSFIFVQKYGDYLPYYRQEAAFERIGVDISRQNMSNWQKKACENVEPLLQLIKNHITSGKVVQMDETEMLVMDEPGKTNRQKSYMRLARGGPPGKQAVWYEYKESREAKHIVELLAGYRGYVQTDGYEAYDAAFKSLEGIRHTGCWAHARRYYMDALKVSKSGGSLAEAALIQIRELYKIEKELRERLEKKQIEEEGFVDERRERSLPVLNALHDWLHEQRGKVLDSSKLGEAVRYTLLQWPKLVRYLEEAELTPDNNGSERSIRPFVMGRKNWVMSGSPAGAKSSCQLYSLIETAKVNGKNPYEYLKLVFEQAADMEPGDDWGQLLPWNLTTNFSGGGRN